MAPCLPRQKAEAARLLLAQKRCLSWGAVYTFTRAGVFLASVEFRASQFEGYFAALLRRPSAAADQPLLTALLTGTADLFDVRVFFEAGPEFFTNG